ncbi:MAG: GH116 family glycosyl-hydrolase [Chthonomonadales bacterium]
MNLRPNFHRFDLQEAIRIQPFPDPIPLGGLDTGIWVANERLLPDKFTAAANVVPISPVDNRGGVYLYIGDGTLSPLTVGNTIAHEALFPLTWRRFLAGPTVDLESVTFSPILLDSARESSLPISLNVYRLKNDSNAQRKFGLLQTLSYSTGDANIPATFDLQHDRLALTGFLGVADNERRVGLSTPDFHSYGKVTQGIEPLAWPGDVDEVLEEFAATGELEPRVAGQGSTGLAAWVSVVLDPQEEFEIPISYVWHDPVRPDGTLRAYTGHLGRTRADNAVVWVAEQAYEDFGTEAATYRFWMQRIHDQHESQIAAGLTVDEINSASKAIF